MTLIEFCDAAILWILWILWGMLAVFFGAMTLLVWSVLCPDEVNWEDEYEDWEAEHNHNKWEGS